ncbi:30S ribosomal protein S12 methylthiotransferase RimO [Porphyromonas sp. COT-290 OH3588]|uniref:30S ribosomal protein S12 methylthiotransferase RimO n=1 Tax=Porphyromonas sp. COT-290 OH3588 TaxID=1515617 RepID=UPI00052BC67B|nr:30S ribosomal protein S12 methylthiotransferase RimO [Porphyromonas sp. COT-290 OH3588]KGN97433.1 ribosomal protein S12 methylthiotransferase [Porphyromonas sp. COT-290 OH3588]
MRKNQVDMITLGCSKNLVDSEHLIRQFLANGYKVQHNADVIDGEIVVINTCGFIKDAQEESINMILNIVESKKRGKVGQVYVMGCLTERFMDELKAEIPEVDGYYGKFNWKKLISDLGKAYYNDPMGGNRSITTPSHYTYLKISEGCDRTCSYCAIPISTGKHRSRSIEDIIKEAQTLVDGGVREVQLIAQDLTYYGLDLYKEHKLPELVERLSDINGLDWLRLHYAYPNAFPRDILRVIRERENVCKYMDIALQHISDPMLKAMRRGTTKAETYDLLHLMRAEVPNLHLRTTLIVGHPGETEQDFAELLDFVRDIRFDRLGAFVYSHEEGTYAYKHYEDNIPLEVKQERINELMRVQEGIATELNAQKIGQTLRTIIDRQEGEYYIGRTEFDSPEVDQEVLIKHTDGTPTLQVGEFYPVEITSADIFDLYGRVVNR